jgi:hypothetical protein
VKPRVARGSESQLTDVALVKEDGFSASLIAGTGRQGHMLTSSGD